MFSLLAKILLAVVLLLSMCGCDVEAGYFDKDRATAETAVHKLRQLYNEGKFAEIYGLGAPELRQSLTEPEFVTSVAQSLSMYGAFKSTNQAAASCFPNQVRFVYLTEFEKAKVTELMIWSVHHGKAELVMYQISPGYADVKHDPNRQCPT
jgi:hypothetical protein